jgi:hypothetical protein
MAAANRTATENARPGSRDWQLTRVGTHTPGKLRSTKVEGYCSAQSVRPGGDLQVMISASPPVPVLLEVFRMGYYGGLGARLVETIGPFDAATQPTPDAGERGVRACGWIPSASIHVTEDWVSGVYIGRLSTRPASSTTVASWQSYIIFIVTDDEPADVLFQCSDNTWQAYNGWPEADSLYTQGRNGTSLHDDYDVSFDRPYGRQAQFESVVCDPLSIGSGEFLSLEFPAAYWLEQHGYSVRYVSNSDMVTPAAGTGCKVLMSLGHDEYWDMRQFESVRALRDAGMSLLFLSGNSVCWVSPLTHGRRTLARKGRYGDQAHEGAKDSVERSGPFPITGNPDEGLLMGARNTLGVMGGGDWRCELPDHWLFEGTGMAKEDTIPGLVGWEFHADPPTPEEVPGLTVVGCGQAFLVGETAQPYTSTVYPIEKGGGAFVFNASTIFWAQGLASPPGHVLPWSHWSRPHGPDARVQKMTDNLLRRALRRGPSPRL